jgi:hypothetical protein
VHGDELCIHGAVQRDAVQHVSARAADTDDAGFQRAWLDGFFEGLAIVFNHGGVGVKGGRRR